MLSYFLITATLALASGIPFEFKRLPGETLLLHLVFSILHAVILWGLPATLVALLLQGFWWRALPRRGL